VPVIVELKRDSTPREAIAQSLDYASWLDALSGEQFRELAKNSVKGSLEDAFSELFLNDLQEIDCQKHRILLVAPKLDAAAERIINYLAERYGIGINAVFFKYAKIGSEEILARSMLVSEEVSKDRRSPASKARPKPEDLDKIAQERNVTELVNTCRKRNAVWDEWPSPKYGGSWRYALSTEQGRRLLLRIAVSDEAMKTPAGELDVWVRPENVAEVTGTDESAVRNAFKDGYLQLAEKFGNLCIRLRTKVEAEKFVHQLKEWTSSPRPQGGAPTGTSDVDLH
jgi:hypothetical protein